MKLRHVLVSKLEPDAQLPVRNNETDAGLDLLSYFDVIIKKGETRVLRTGCAVLIPEGYVGLIFPKSRSDYLIGGGVVDAGYAGEIKVKVVNTTDRTIALYHGQEIAQMIITPVETPALCFVEDYETVKHVGESISGRGTEGGINR